MEYLDQTAASCGYTGYMEKYVTYPPEGLLPLPGSSVEFDDGCDVWDAIFSAALLVNPAFDIYRIFDTVCPHPPFTSMPHTYDRANDLVADPMGCARLPGVLPADAGLAPVLQPRRRQGRNSRPAGRGLDRMLQRERLPQRRQ